MANTKSGKIVAVKSGRDSIIQYQKGENLLSLMRGNINLCKLTLISC